MGALYYKAKDLMPGILLDRETGKFQISGISCPIDPFEFYKPVFEWFDEYIKNPLKNTVLDLNMTYFNTASAKFLLRIMTNLNKLSSKDNKVKVRWYYSETDHDMKEEGVEFKNILSLDFELIPIKSKSDESKEEKDFDRFMDDIL